MTCNVLGYGYVTSTATVIAFCFTLACGLSGCGGSAGETKGGNARISASGTVEFDGEPVPAGIVTFLHTETGYIANCEIYDGEYESKSGEGPNPGKNVVMVNAKETAEGNRMWQNPWKTEVQVGDSDFMEDFAIASADVTPLDPSTIQIDE